jgi:pyridinium-3,5-biscarboxylic acid mononucleotide sulfurtransferase
LTKPEIREISAALGLPTADKPQMACLSSRIPYGEAVSPQKLAMIEQAENVLRDLGFHDVRVRHHELPETASATTATAGLPVISPATKGRRHLARIEVGPAELPKFLQNGNSVKISGALKQLGYAHVTVDLEGYRRGSINEKIPTGGSEG